MLLEERELQEIRSEEGDFVVFVPNTLPGQLVKATN